VDPDSSTNVRITNTNINVADDGICPKSSVGFGPLRNLYVANCTVRSKSHALKFGSNTDTEMSNIFFENITIWDSNSGIAMQNRGAGDVHNVTFRDIRVETRYVAPRWWGNGEWLTITSQPRNRGDKIGRVYDILLQNITARSENGGLVSGMANGMQNLSLVNVHVTIDRFGNYSDGSGPPCCLSQCALGRLHELVLLAAASAMAIAVPDLVPSPIVSRPDSALPISPRFTLYSSSSSFLLHRHPCASPYTSLTLPPASHDNSWWFQAHMYGH